jgi:hypothetical protein
VPSWRRGPGRSRPPRTSQSTAGAAEIPRDLIRVPAVDEGLNNELPERLVSLELHALELGLVPADVGPVLGTGGAVGACTMRRGPSTRGVAIAAQLPAAGAVRYAQDRANGPETVVFFL